MRISWISVGMAYLVWIVTWCVSSIGERDPAFTVNWRHVLVLLILTLAPAIIGFFSGVQFAEGKSEKP